MLINPSTAASFDGMSPVAHTCTVQYILYLGIHFNTYSVVLLDTFWCLAHFSFAFCANCSSFIVLSPIFFSVCL